MKAEDGNDKQTFSSNSRSMSSKIHRYFSIICSTLGVTNKFLMEQSKAALCLDDTPLCSCLFVIILFSFCFGYAFTFGIFGRVTRPCIMKDAMPLLLNDSSTSAPSISPTRSALLSPSPSSSPGPSPSSSPFPALFPPALSPSPFDWNATDLLIWLSSNGFGSASCTQLRDSLSLLNGTLFLALNDTGMYFQQFLIFYFLRLNLFLYSRFDKTWNC